MEGCCPRVAAILEEGEPDALTYYDFPPLPRRHLRANNVQERANRKIKCGSRMMQSFAGAAGRCGHVRAGRDMAGVQILLGGKDE